MTPRIKVFIIAFVLSLPFFWGINVFAENLENFFFQQISGKNPQIFTAQIAFEETIKNLRPFRNQEVDNLDLGARSAISVLIRDNGTSKIIFEKNPQARLPIASITKLTTSLIVLENYELSEIIEISQETASFQEEYGYGSLKIGEKFSVEQLLYFLLIESSNGASFALAKKIGQDRFVSLMNIKAAELGLTNTFFSNPTGLDNSEIFIDERNISTVKDLAILGRYLKENHSLVWQIAKNQEIDLYLSDGILYRQLQNTNTLLSEFPQFGGKTGWTPEAGGCLLLISHAPNNRGYLVNVVLGSGSRFEDMRRLINWTEEAYIW